MTYTPKLVMPKIGLPTNKTLKDDFTTRGSAGVLDGTLTYLIAGSTSVKVTVNAGEGYIRKTNDQQGELVFCKWDAAVDLYTFSAPAAGQETAVFFGISYNGGNPIAIYSSTFADFNGYDKFWLGRVSYDGTTMRILNSYAHSEDTANGTRLWMRKNFPFHREEPPEGSGGLELSSSGSPAERSVAMSAGNLWHGYNQYVLSALASGTAFDAHYRRAGGGFNKNTGVTQFPNTQYDDGSGTLVTMTNNRYACLWFFVDVADGTLDVIYGRGQYVTSIQAQAEGVPSTPNHLTYHGRLIGRIIFQKSATTYTVIESAWATVFSGASLQIASEVPFTPAGGITASNVQAAIEELDTEKQPLDADLTAIAGLSPADDDIIQRKSGAWINRTLANLLADFPIAVGSWTPTLSNTTNVAASSVAAAWWYVRILGLVFGFGIVAQDPTSGGTLTTLGLTIPIASNFGVISDLVGTANAASGTGEYGGALFADSANDRIILRTYPIGTGNQLWYCIFGYRII